MVKQKAIRGSSIFLFKGRPAQLAELSRSKFDTELFSHSAYVKFFFNIRDRSVVFNILRQNETIFDIGNGQRGRKKRENEKM